MSACPIRSLLFRRITSSRQRRPQATCRALMVFAMVIAPRTMLISTSFTETPAQRGLDQRSKRRILIGAYVLSHGYYDAYYKKAQQLRRRIADEFAQCFEQVDVIAGPVCPTTAWQLGSRKDDPVQNYLADIFTLPASLAGLPGISVPAGFESGTHPQHPIGLQIIGNYFDESKLLNIAHQYQQATDWHLRSPQEAS